MSSDQFPRGKFSADDEGALLTRIAVKDKTVIIHFGKPIVWIGLDKASAEKLARSILQHAAGIK